MQNHLNILKRIQLPAPALQLAVVRLVFCLYIFSVLLSPVLPTIFDLFGSHIPDNTQRTAFPSWLEAWVGETAGPWLLYLGMVAALFGALGLFTRVALPILFVCFLLLQNYYIRVTMFHDDWVYFNFFLLVLSVAPCNEAYSLDKRLFKMPANPQPSTRYRWPLEMMKFWFASIYIAAAIAKLFPLNKGIVWMLGDTVREMVGIFIFDSPIYWILGRTLFDYTIVWPFTIVAVLTLIVEFAALILLFTHRYQWIILASIMGMHIGIYMVGIPQFVQVALFSMIVFLPSHWFDNRLKPLGK